MPPFAESALEASQRSQTLNIFGTPDYSNFASYAYAAGPHVDDDDAPTSGWVVSRSAKVMLSVLRSSYKLINMQVMRHESNFMWAGYKLLVELAQDCFWFWDAKKDMHGTTMNKIACKHKGHQNYFKDKDAKERAQWTRVLTLTEAVARSHLRHV